MKHVLRIPLVALAFILAAIAPFLPGEPDAAAMPVSMVAYPRFAQGDNTGDNELTACRDLS